MRQLLLSMEQLHITLLGSSQRYGRMRCRGLQRLELIHHITGASAGPPFGQPAVGRGGATARPFPHGLWNRYRWL